MEPWRVASSTPAAELARSAPWGLSATRRALVVGRVARRLGAGVLVAVDGDVDDQGRGSGVAPEAHPDLFHREADGSVCRRVDVILDRPWRVREPLRPAQFLAYKPPDCVAVDSAAAGVVQLAGFKHRADASHRVGV